MDRKLIVGALSALAIFVILATPKPAQAALQICNNSGERIDTAVAYYYDIGFDAWWDTEGWWVLQPGGCATVVKYDLDYRYYYVYGNGSGHVWSGDTNFCVNTQDKFDFTDADKECTNGVYRGFRKIDTGDSKNYTWSFTN